MLANCVINVHQNKSVAGCYRGVVLCCQHASNETCSSSSAISDPPHHVFAQAGGGGAAALGRAHCEEGAGFLGAHCGHCGPALHRERSGQEEDNRYEHTSLHDVKFTAW